MSTPNGNGSWRSLVLPLLLAVAAGILGFQANEIIGRVATHELRLGSHDMAITELRIQRAADSASLQEIEQDTKAMRRLLAKLADRAGISDQ